MSPEENGGGHCPHSTESSGIPKLGMPLLCSGFLERVVIYLTRKGGFSERGNECVAQAHLFFSDDAIIAADCG